MGSWGWAALAHAHSSAALLYSRSGVSDTASHRDVPWVCLVGRVARFNLIPSRGGVAQLQASLTAFICGSLYLALNTKVRSLWGAWLQE